MQPVSIDELKPDPKNPRTLSQHDGQALSKSITTFGDLSCIVFNQRTQQLVGGHQRLEIMKRLSGEKRIELTRQYETPDEVGSVAIGYIYIGNKQFAYRVVDWDEGTQRAANIAANRISGEFDIDLLAQVNYELSLLENGAELLALTGQTEDEISKLLDSVGAGEVEEDEAPPVDDVNPAVSQLGEIYQLGSHRLMCGSATDFGQVTDLFNGVQMDLVYTDPPYGIDIVGDNGMVGAGNLATNKVYAKVEGDGGIETASEFYNTCVALEIKKSIIWGGNYFTEFLPFSDGWLIWDKRGDMNGNSFADGEMAWCSFHTPVRIYKQIWNGMIREGEKEERVHPTQKPVKVLSDILADFSERGDKIYDGFGGSGSILIACENMGRTCYMMELDPKYTDVIRKRYAKHIGQEDWASATPVIQAAEAPVA